MARNNGQVLTTHEAARAFGVTPMTVIRWIEDGKLTAWKTAGGHRRIDVAELRRFAAAQGKVLTVGDVGMRARALAPGNALVLVQRAKDFVETIPDAPAVTELDRARWAKQPELRDEHARAEGRAQVRDGLKVLLAAFEVGA